MVQWLWAAHLLESILNVILQVFSVWNFVVSPLRTLVVCLLVEGVRVVIVVEVVGDVVVVGMLEWKKLFVVVGIVDMAALGKIV